MYGDGAWHVCTAKGGMQMSEVSLERDRVGFMRVTSLSFFFSFFFFGPVELEGIPSFLTFCFRIIDIKNVDYFLNRVENYVRFCQLNSTL